jgi:hypothetical protein
MLNKGEINMRYITTQLLENEQACEIGVGYFLKCFPNGKARITKTNINKFLSYKFYCKSFKLGFVVWFSRNVLKVNETDFEKLDLIRVNCEHGYIINLEEIPNYVWNIIRKYVK